MQGVLRFGNAVAAGALGLVLLAGFVLQFALGELPCPLCNLQRVAFVLCGFGFVLNLRFGSHPYHYGLSILAALFGLAASGRQVLLHITTGVGAYGSPILGLHLYSWAFVLFAAIIAGIAVLLLAERARAVEPHRSGARRADRLSGLPRLAAGFLVLMTFANAVMSFVQCGPIECPDDPTGYWLLSRLFG